MATFKNTLKSGDNDNASYGLAAIGSAGGWEVAIDQTTSGEQRWFAQIEGPSVYLYFEVESSDVIRKMLEFLTAQTNVGGGSLDVAAPLNGELVLSKSTEEPVTLMRDDEFSDRYFLVVETASESIVRITIGDTDLKMLERALRQAREDLDEDEPD